MTTQTTIRLASAAAAAVLTFGLVAAISQGLHIQRLETGLPLVQLEPVTVTAGVVITEKTLAAAPAATRAN